MHNTKTYFYQTEDHFPEKISPIASLVRLESIFSYPLTGKGFLASHLQQTK
jgi:hypothetical protein